MRPLVSGSRTVGQVVAPRWSRIHAAIWAAFAVGAVPAVFAPQAGAQILDCTGATAGNPPGCTGDGQAEISAGDSYDEVNGVYQPSGNARSGSVTMTGGMVQGGVYGGYARGSYNASSNTVEISGGMVQGSVFGGG